MADEPQPNQTAPSGPESANQESPKEQAEPPAPDSLEKSEEEVAVETDGQSAAEEDAKESAESDDKKKGKGEHPIKTFLRRFNVYFLMFLLVLVIAIVIVVVAYLNSKREPVIPSLTNQTLDVETLQQLANADATVGDPNQTLTIQGNAIVSGQMLVRGNLNVAGTIQLGGEFSVPDLIVSGSANLAETQLASLQVAQDSIFQGEVTLQDDLNVAGESTFNGTVTAGHLVVSRLTMSGNGRLEIPNHITFTGANPNRSINPSVLGSGGSGSVNGSDTSGTVNLNTGSNPTAGCFVRVVFNVPYENTPHVIISPIGAAAGQTNYYATVSNTEFSICTANTPPANQSFSFSYFVTGT
jgi:cytoskeletal protein CcmA (bactofilin family)